MFILDWRGKMAMTTRKLTEILLTQVIRCQQASPRWINLRKHLSKKLLLLYGKPVMTCMIIENGHSSCLWPPTAQGLGTGWDINHSLTGKVPSPHFLPDLAERHFQVSNYHYGAKATPIALQRGVLASP